MFVLLDLYDFKPWEQYGKYGEQVLKPEDKAAILQLRRFQKDGEQRLRKEAESRLGNRSKRTPNRRN